jgi:1-acyl-sn-glycerol-3-phosphate acyltransferase
VGNHPYATDGFVLPLIFKEKLHFAIQANVFDTPIVGRMLTLAGQIPVKVGQGQEMLKTAVEWLEKGQDIVIFPEGRLNFGKDLHRAGSGAALLALQTGAPVLPLGIWTPPEYTPTSQGSLLKRPAAESWQMGGKLYIKIGEPLLLMKPADTSHLHRYLRDCTSQIMNSVSELVVQIQK